MTDDNELLRRFARDRCEEAFTELVSRNLKVVYSAALRQANGDHETARDIAQTVFIDLARKAEAVAGHESIVGWLHTSTRYAATMVRRSEQRRKEREKNAIMMANPDSSEKEWEEVAPILDDAIAELGSEDRIAILQRFLKGCELREVGRVLGVSEDAARMRVTRALEKLHTQLTARGVTLAAGALGTLLSVHSVSAAPATLAKLIATGSIGSVSASAPSLVSRWSASKILAGSAALMLVILFAILPIIHRPQKTQPLPGSERSDSESSAATFAQSTNASVVNLSTAAAPIAELMTFSAVDLESGAPLTNAWFRLHHVSRASIEKKQEGNVDLEGKAQLNRTQAPDGAILYAMAPGHVPLMINWRKGMPDSYTMKFPQGSVAGGIVVDETQAPVAGARISFHSGTIDRAGAEKIALIPEIDPRTDLNGRWSCDMLPKGVQSIQVVLTHPDFAITESDIFLNRSEATNSVLVIKRGVALSGVVEDEMGRPIEGAEVRETHHYTRPKLSAKTDGAGRFEFAHTHAGEMTLTASSTNLAPLALVCVVSNQPVSLRFVLGAPNVLKGHVVNQSGQPITGVRISTPYMGTIPWTGMTDGNGRFLWRNAPKNPPPLTFRADGFASIEDRTLSADGADHFVQMASSEIAGMKPITISLSVADGKTGEPLKDFQVLTSQHHGNGSTEFEYALDAKSSEASLELEPIEGDYVIQIQKEGYQPFISTNHPFLKGNQKLSIQLRNAKEIYGLVLLSDLSPAVGATVFLYDAEGDGVYMDKPGAYRNGISRAPRVITDGEGRFSFNANDGALGMIAIHQGGYAEISLSQFSTHVVLQPWGRVEGKLQLAGRAMPNEKIYLHSVQYRAQLDGRKRGPALMLHLSTTSDAAGKFVFEQVPPGDRMVAHTLADPVSGRRRIYFGREAFANVEPGKITKIDLGGYGVSVAGKIMLPVQLSGTNLQYIPVELSLRDPAKASARPNAWEFADRRALFEALRSASLAYQGFWESEEGREATRAARSYWAFANEDGSFGFRDIPSGSYNLTVKIFEPEDSFGIEPVAGVSVPVQIGNDQVELGKIELKATPYPPAVMQRVFKSK